ncbi:hypothetical protein ACFYRY_42045 [Streptomyces sp. NPDC005263]|uniref:hypothetical protein n=1 Tax=Streptomyces sp. NPDC005263 TaxID=3364711 RepID=UPI0036D0B97D
MIDERDPALRMAEVIREAVTCDRDHCLPEAHVRFVEENLEIAAKEIGGPVR